MPKRGRPKGSTDGPRAEGAPPRGRPRTRPRPKSDSEDESVDRPSKKRKRTADTSRATLPIPARQNPWMLPAETAAIAATTQQADEYDQYFDDDHFTPDAEEEIARIEREALGDHSQMVSTSAQPVHTTPSLSAEQLKDASKRSRAQTGLEAFAAADFYFGSCTMSVDATEKSRFFKTKKGKNERKKGETQGII
ncbi:hypothetical protein R3P38DRAFT_2771092 [Favolaschia claudopus]|uniref:Uncharacterized protein n=1 Tax=Favolaschia claudopus TaxID=2862362 RepID=A0AAW0CFY3_9AGAR